MPMLVDFLQLSFAGIFCSRLRIIRSKPTSLPSDLISFQCPDELRYASDFFYAKCMMSF